MKVRILSILLFAVNLGFGQIYIDSYRFASAAPLEVEYLVVGGGGGGGSIGGGGAGGYRSSVQGELSGGNTASEPVFIANTSTNYIVTVGQGGSYQANGANSVFDNIISLGGGAGGTPPNVGSNGGSGGGGALLSSVTGSGSRRNGGSGTTGQGFAGGYGEYYGTPFSGGGGGGAGAVGKNYNQPANGGNGIASSITGTSVYRAGGGGGHTRNLTTTTGGLGGGGNGNNNYSGGTSGGQNTGGGAGGGIGLVGGSGVVILRYPSGYTITNPGGGLTFTTTTAGSDKVTTFTSGTGNIQFN